MMMRGCLLWAIVFSCGVTHAWRAHAEPSNRVTLSLDGTWEIEDSVAPDTPPKTFAHTVPVPGLAHSAVPAFPQVDEYQTKQLLSDLVTQNLYSQADYDRLGDIRGISHQDRNYFWYRKTFQAPSQRAVALLQVRKAQFGIVAYLNGVRIGAHDICFTAANFDASKAIRWSAENEIIIRVGAHPGVLPANVSQGTDFEKNRWTPGIYDDVSLLAMDNPVISEVQAAPQLDASGDSVLVQTELHNYAARPVTTKVTQQVRERASGVSVVPVQVMTLDLPAGATKIVTQRIAVPKAHLWSPSDPFLYQVETGTNGDAVATRFGMREFHFDTVTQRAYLNGRPFFLRGSNIALHRFFEDKAVGTLPWDAAWVHRLLVDIPKQLHWNAFRFTIGPVPDRWLEIADENGLLIENQFFVWVGSPLWTKWHAHYDPVELTREYTEWMRDNWNHPSVVIWDANNESWVPELAGVIPSVRSLDLSNRPWQNSYNAPDGDNDPVEDHQYLLESTAGGFNNSNSDKPFALEDLEGMEGPVLNPFVKTGHATILNEYGWLWLNRDGSPTLLTNKLYPKMLGKNDNVAARRALESYMLGGETEFWRAYRHYAGVLQFVYLTASEPNGFTSDQFIDVKKLELEPHFAEAMAQSFQPLGVYLNFWQATLDAGQMRNYTINLVNDDDRTRAGRLRLAFVDEHGKEVAASEMPFRLARLGTQSYIAGLKAPDALGRYSLRATARAEDDVSAPSVSTRNLIVQSATNPP